MVQVGFWINNPFKKRRFNQHWENFAAMLQFEDLAVKKFFFFLLHAYFCVKTFLYGYEQFCIVMNSPV